MKEASKPITAAHAHQQKPFFNTSGPGHFFDSTQAAAADAFFSRTGSQPKLDVGKRDDPMERQADQVADKVVRRLAVPSQAGSEKKEEDTSREREEMESSGTVLRRKAAFESDDPQDQKPGIQRMPFAVMRKTASAEPASAPDAVEASLNTSKGGGAAMEESTRSKMESAFDADFSSVRIHTGNEAQQMSQALNAQAFTHGNDIYFNEGKYAPGSSQGSHLLAHELTHTIQQGGSVRRKHNNDTIAPAAKSIQRSPDGKKEITQSDLDKIPAHEYGTIRKQGSMVEVRIANFPVKQYSSPFVSKDKAGNEALAAPPFKKPKGERKTKQGSTWRSGALPDIRGSLQSLLDKSGITATDLVLRLKKSKALVTGTIEQIASEIVVPFWGMDGKPVKHEIEHKVDWQVAGGTHNVDHISNLILLDSTANKNIGGVIDKTIKKYVAAIVAYYKKQGIEGLSDNIADMLTTYDIFFENLKAESESVKGSLISISNLHAGAGNNPINANNVELADAQIKEGHFILKTSKTGAGSMVPYGLSNEFVEIEGDAKKHEVTSIKIKKVVKDTFGNLEVEEVIPLSFVKEAQDVYRITTKGYAGLLKDSIRVKGLSPVAFDDADFNVFSGMSAAGKVVTDVPLLKGGVDIGFTIESSGYALEATITTDAFSKMLPKPFAIDYGMFRIKAGSGQKLSVAGEFGFSIDKVGKGVISAQSGKEFALAGKFDFDKSVFNGSLQVGYSKDKGWEVGGSAKIGGGKIKGLKSADIRFSYAGDAIKIGGKAYLTLPGIKEIDIDATIGQNGDFVISTTLDVSKIPKVKSGAGKLTIAKIDGVWDIGIVATVQPDIDFNGLKILSSSFTYQKGVFDIKFGVSYEGKRLSGTGNLGVTNTPVAEGKKAEGEGGADMQFYGDIKLLVKLVEDLEGEINSHFKPDGDVIVDGSVKLTNDKPLFTFPSVNKSFLDVNKNIPVASCGVVTLSIHLGGHGSLYANADPLAIKAGSNIAISNLNLRKMNAPDISSQLKVGTHFKAGVKAGIEVGLDASLLAVLHAGIDGTVDADFVAIDADALCNIEMGWSADKGFYMKDSELKLKLDSKLIFSIGVTARVYLDLLLGTITIWDHHWDLASKELKLPLFQGLGDLSIPLSAQEGKIAAPNVEAKLADVKQAVNDPEKVAKRVQDHAIDGKEASAEDKKAMANDDIKKQIVALFTNADRFQFNASRNYLQDRYDTYYYLKNEAAATYNIDFSYLDDVIRNCEVEEYDAFSIYIMNEREFDDGARAIIIEDFITNHPMLNETEVANLRSLQVTVPPQAKDNKPNPKKPPSRKTGKQKEK